MFAVLMAGPVEYVRKWNFLIILSTLNVGSNFEGIMLSAEYYKKNVVKYGGITDPMKESLEDKKYILCCLYFHYYFSYSCSLLLLLCVYSYVLIFSHEHSQIAFLVIFGKTVINCR